MTTTNSTAADPAPSSAQLLTTTTSGVDNLALWNSYRTPDASACKNFNRSGGFTGTATNACYLIRCATEAWGPMGGNWGIRIADEKIIEGATQIWKEMPMVDKVYVIRAELFYPGGIVPAYGQTTLCGINKYGPFTDEEAPKKSLTDALTKALSWLGFASDIHMGLWDDNKHTNRPGQRDDNGQRAGSGSRQPQGQARASQSRTAPQAAASSAPAAAPAAPPSAEAATLSQARKACLDAGLTRDGAAAAAMELTNGQSQAFSAIPAHLLSRMASEGVPAETIARWNAAGAAAAQQQQQQQVAA